MGKENTGNKGREAQQKVKEAASEAQDRAKGFLDRQKDCAAERVSHIAEALRRTGENLQEEDETISHCTQMIAEKVEDMAAYLKDQDVRSLTVEARKCARRRPEIFLGGAFALGVIVSRFIKSSAEEEYCAQDEADWQRADGGSSQDLGSRETGPIGKEIPGEG